MSATATARVWDDEQQQQLRDLYPLLESDEQITALAAEMHVTAEALRTQAKRLGLRRPAPASRHEFSADDDAMLRRCLTDTDDPAAGFALAAEQIGVSAQACSWRWRQLQRRRRARIGDWTERELAHAAQHGNVPGRSSDETTLRLLTLGVRCQQDPAVPLGELARRAGLGMDTIRQAVLAGELAASRPDTGSVLPDEQWVTSEQRVGAWLVAYPHLIEGLSDSVWGLRMAFACGMRAGQQLRSPNTVTKEMP